MTPMTTRIPVALMALLLAAATPLVVRADEPSSDKSVADHAKEIGATVKDDAKKVGTVVKEDAKKVGAVVKEDAKKVGAAAKDTAVKVGEGAKEGAEKVKTAVKKKTTSHEDDPKPEPKP